MDTDWQEARAQSDEFSSPLEHASRAGPTTWLLRWEGSCVGDDVSSIGGHVLRIVAIQAAGSTDDLPTWVNQRATQLRAMGAHVGVYTDTRIHGGDRHTQVSNLFRDYGFLAISHNTTTSRFTFPITTEEDNEVGPRAAGVILVVTAEYAGGWTDIAYDTDGRAINANINFSDDSTVRMTVAYGG